MSKQQVHEEILELNENSRGELMTQVMELTNAKDPKLGLKFATVNKYYQELLRTYDPRDIHILGKPLDGGTVTLKTLNYDCDDLKHADENYYSSLPKQVKERLQGVYYSVTITVMITKKSKKNI